MTFFALCLHNVWHTVAHHHGRGYNRFTCLFIKEPKLVVLFALCEEKIGKKKSWKEEKKASLYQIEAHEGEGKLLKEAFVVEKKGNEGSGSKTYKSSKVEVHKVVGSRIRFI